MYYTKEIDVYGCMRDYYLDSANNILYKVFGNFQTKFYFMILIMNL